MSSQLNHLRYYLLPESDTTYPTTPTPHTVVPKVSTTESAFKPDKISGICCPVGTIVNHEHPETKARNVLFALEILLHFLAGIAIGMDEAYEQMFLQWVTLDQHGELSKRDWEVVENQKYLSHGQRVYYWTVITIWVLWNIVTRIIFFFLYNPRNAHRVSVPMSRSEKRDQNELSLEHYVVYKPSLLTRLFFPLSTVYYHEGNTFFHLKFLVAYLFRWFYTVCCYKPTYEEDAEMAERIQADIEFANARQGVVHAVPIEV